MSKNLKAIIIYQYETSPWTHPPPASPLVNSSETSLVAQVLTEILVKLKLGAFTVKINHRTLLDGMMKLCGVPAGKFRTICSAIDKLDKESWDTVRAEMVDEKGLSPEVTPASPDSASGQDWENILITCIPHRRTVVARLKDTQSYTLQRRP